jgi:hypothetical protein
VRTTVDLDPALLERAKRLALAEHRTLGAVLGDALAAYIGSRRLAAKDPPFEVMVRGKSEARFPSQVVVASIEDEEDTVALAIPPVAGL